MDATEQQLIEIFRQLDSGDRSTLVAFAGFLAQRGSAVPAAPPVSPPGETAAARVIPEPEPIERPAGETVVGALKRLSRTYPMLDKSRMLSATSELVAQHIMKGTEAAGAIDALEQVFRDHYRQLRQDCDDTA
jgi:hypothetical protein